MVTPYLKNGMRIRLICDPFFETRLTDGGRQNIKVNNCYDVYDLGILGPGAYAFEVYADKDDDILWVVMETITSDTLPRVKRKRDRQTTSRPKTVPSGATAVRSATSTRKEIALPLYFHVGSNCVLVDSDHADGNPTLRISLERL